MFATINDQSNSSIQSNSHRPDAMPIITYIEMKRMGWREKDSIDCTNSNLLFASMPKHQPKGFVILKADGGKGGNDD